MSLQDMQNTVNISYTYPNHDLPGSVSESSFVNKFAPVIVEVKDSKAQSLNLDNRNPDFEIDSNVPTPSNYKVRSRTAYATDPHNVIERSRSRSQSPIRRSNVTDTPYPSDNVFVSDVMINNEQDTIDLDDILNLNDLDDEFKQVNSQIIHLQDINDEEEKMLLDNDEVVELDPTLDLRCINCQSTKINKAEQDIVKYTESGIVQYNGDDIPFDPFTSEFENAIESMLEQHYGTSEIKHSVYDNAIAKSVMKYINFDEKDMNFIEKLRLTNVDLAAKEVLINKIKAYVDKNSVSIENIMESAISLYKNDGVVHYKIKILPAIYVKDITPFSNNSYSTYNITEVENFNYKIIETKKIPQLDGILFYYLKMSNFFATLDDGMQYLNSKIDKYEAISDAIYTKSFEDIVKIVKDKLVKYYYFIIRDYNLYMNDGIGSIANSVLRFNNISYGDLCCRKDILGSVKLYEKIKTANISNYNLNVITNTGDSLFRKYKRFELIDKDSILFDNLANQQEYDAVLNFDGNEEQDDDDELEYDDNNFEENDYDDDDDDIIHDDFENNE